MLYPTPILVWQTLSEVNDHAVSSGERSCGADPQVPIEDFFPSVRGFQQQTGKQCSVVCVRFLGLVNSPGAGMRLISTSSRSTVEFKLSTAHPFHKSLRSRERQVQKERGARESACVPARFNCPLHCLESRRELRAALVIAAREILISLSY